MGAEFSETGRGRSLGALTYLMNEPGGSGWRGAISSLHRFPRLLGASRESVRQYAAVGDDGMLRHLSIGCRDYRIS